MVICLERGADLHMAQLMPLPLTVSCFSKIQIGFTFLVPTHPSSPRKRLLNKCVCVCVYVHYAVPPAAATITTWDRQTDTRPVLCAFCYECDQFNNVETLKYFIIHLSTNI